MESVLPSAVALSIAVADFDGDAVSRILADLGLSELQALSILLAAHVNLDRPLTIDLPDPVTPDRVVTRAVNLAAEMFCVSPGDLTGDARQRPALDGRAVAMAALRLCGMSSPSVGQAFGRDHSTVLYAQSRVGENSRLRALSQRIAMQCGWDRENVEETA
jgi:chromosomal replication initiation ATPase DnaA